MSARRLPLAVYYVMSAAAHGGFAWWVSVHPSAARRQERLDVQVVETLKPRRVEPASEPMAHAPAPPALTRPLRVPRTPPLQRSASRPTTPSPGAPTAEPVAPIASAPTAAVKLGISLASSSTSGGLAVPTGRGSGDPALSSTGGEASGPEMGPIARATDLTTLPEAINAEVPKSEYPAQALDGGFEGAVTLRIVVDAFGRVRRATVLKDPGYGLGAAAVRIATQYFRFRPGQRSGHAVATEIPFTVYFELP